MDRPSLRPATVDDAARVAELLGQLGYACEVAQAARRIAAYGDDPAGAVLVAEGTDGIAGLVAFHMVPHLEHDGRWCRITALVVDSDARGAGVGRRLVRAVEEHAAAAGCRSIEVTSSRRREEAHAFYAALGYADACERSARLLRHI